MRTFDPSRLSQFQNVADARVALATELALNQGHRDDIRGLIAEFDAMVAKGQTFVWLLEDDDGDEVLVGCDGFYRSTFDFRHVPDNQPRLQRQNK
jgi:hypothetical protein